MQPSVMDARHVAPTVHRGALKVMDGRARKISIELFPEGAHPEEGIGIDRIQEVFYSGARMERTRCSWCVGNPLYEAYHDTEWGTPSWDDTIHFEFLVLESAQAGLSWITILRKRPAYRDAYAGFDWDNVARYGEKEVETLLSNPRIVRNRRKIEASIVNARKFLEIRERYGSFSTYLWNFVDGKPVIGHRKTMEEVPSSTELSTRIAKDLKSKGFQFLGSIIVYAHLQATGIVNDHLVDCFRYKDLVYLYL